jgi:Winged helix DNA-binding domain
MANINISTLRLLNQKLIHQDLETPQAVTAHMGALQAQDFAMSKWALGMRLPNFVDKHIEAAFDAGEIVRTHVLRPTWHIVSGNDVRWMLSLTGKHIKAASASRDRDLGIDTALYNRTNDLIVKALEGGKNLTREEVMIELEKGGVKTDASRAVHFMMNAEVDAIVCNGKMRGKEQTYALMDEKIPKGLVFTREEAIVALAERYFTSHAPATLPDFQWWSGLPMSDARKGLESVKSNLISYENAGKTYFYPKHLSDTEGVLENIFFLPAFDEYCVSYKDRSAVFDPTWHKEAITSNGIFKPIIVVNGLVTGTWKRTVQKNKLIIETVFFDKNSILSANIIEKATARFGTFLGLPIEIK